MQESASTNSMSAPANPEPSSTMAFVYRLIHTATNTTPQTAHAILVSTAPSWTRLQEDADSTQSATLQLSTEGPTEVV